MEALFQGRYSLREPSERRFFWLTIVCALPAALLIGYVLHESIGVSQAALFIVIAMVYVTLARGRLVGSSVRVHERQYPRLFTIVKRACASLEIPMPFVFVREDNYVPVVALGFGEPYALIVSSHWIELYADDELAFVIGRELGHIAAGHTRFHSLLSVNGNENPLVSLVFGAWLRRCALTCDKVGLLCCGSIDAAIRAMGLSAFHEFGRKVDYQAFAEQETEIQSDSVLRWGEWLSSEPYATRRIASLRTFVKSQAYANAYAWFCRERNEEPPALAVPGHATVAPRDCAGWWRRFAAWGIDAVVVSAIITSFGGSVAPGVPVNVSTTSNGGVYVTVPGIAPVSVNVPVPGVTPAPVQEKKPTAAGRPPGTPAHPSEPLSKRIASHWFILPPLLAGSIYHLGFFFWFPVYLALLVIVAGQTFGMMIAGLRVVTTNFRKPSIGRSIIRYVIVFLAWWIIVPLSLIWRHVLLHDRWTKTRVVKVERVVARVSNTW